MQALALIRNQIRFSGLFVMLRLERRARLHGREDRHQARLRAACIDDLPDPVFLTEVLLTDVFDLDAVSRSQFLGVVPDLIPEWLGKARIIEDPDIAGVQQRGHPFRIANLRKRAEQ